MAWRSWGASRLSLLALALAACDQRSPQAAKTAEGGAIDAGAAPADDASEESEAAAPDPEPDTRVDAASDTGSDDASDMGSDDAGATSLADAGARRGRRVLFVGNSFVTVNDVAGHYREIVGDVIPGALVEQVAPGGYKLVQHAEDARVDGSALARFLRTGTAEETSFDAVVLQEQSQLGGFPPKTKQRLASIAAASELAKLASERGALVVLYETWGYELGDPANALQGYDTYTGMQDELDQAYLGVASMLREQGAAARLAPVGGGFRIVFEDVTRAGADPLAEGSEFDALYEPDGVHPSLHGAYLASCIIAATITQADARAFRAEPRLGAETSLRLRDVCARAVADPRWHVPTVVRAAAALKGAGTAFANFGATVASSADADRLLIGESHYPAVADAGSAWIYTREGPSWTSKTRWEGLAVNGSLALNADATIALMGPPTRMLRRTGEAWSEEATLSQGPNATAGRRNQLALSADGTRALVGEPAGGGEMVAARVFVQRAGGWEQEAALHGLTPDSAGAPLAFDRSGERALVGPLVYARGSEGWHLEAALSVLGAAVALSGDGRHAALSTEAQSLITLFVREGERWIEQAALRGLSSLRFGASLALDHDGRRLLVGLPGDTPVATAALRGDTTGSVRFYELHEGVFRHEYVLVPDVTPESIAPYGFASAMVLGDDGTVVIGAPAWGTTTTLREGRVYTFVLR